MAESRLVQVSRSVHAWIGVGGDSNAGVIDTPRGLVVIDTQQLPALAHDFRAEMEETLRKSVRMVVNTHFHLDHVAGNAVFADVPILAHEKTLALLTAMLGPRSGAVWTLEGFEQTAKLLWGGNLLDLVPAGAPDLDWFRQRIGGSDYASIPIAPPSETFADRFDIPLDHDVIALRYHGPAHCDGDVIVHLPGEKVAFLGDLMFYRRFPWMGDCDLDGWIDRLRTVLTMDIETVIPGHGPPTDLAEVARFRQLFVDLRAKTAEALRWGSSEEAAMVEVHLAQYAHLPRYTQWRAVNVRAAYRYLSGRTGA